MDNSAKNLTKAVLSSLFVALISIGAYIALPLPGSPVPIVLQNMFIMLAALILGPWWGLTATSLYLLLGLLGMPVFSGGTGGIAKLLGPTGGYLVGYIPATIVMGLIAKLGGRKFFPNLIACLVGMAIVDAFGILRLKAVLDLGWGKALAAGLFPFIPGDLIKIVLASLAAPKLYSAMESLATHGDDA
ncbi:MAG: biotin transporter BioY [Rectinemataceae bacterium]|nr:biotin transporter BioY [Rectinemataceae bacterium]